MTFDPTVPNPVVLIAVLHFIDEPADQYGIVARLMDAAACGSRDNGVAAATSASGMAP